jgi:hypothetical protein
VRHTIELLKENLQYSGLIQYVVSEDGPDLPDISYEHVRVVKGPEKGLGGNLNSLLRTDCDVVLQMDDDVWLTMHLNLDRHVQALLDDPLAGWIRFRYIADHGFDATLKGSYWWVNWNSVGLYIASNQVHLKRRRFHDVFGFYAESATLALTENGFCAQCKGIARGRNDVPQVLVPLDVMTESGWDHVGDSWQIKGY